MNNKLASSILVVVICLFVFSTSACSQSPQYKEQTLPSGRTIKISAFMKINFTKDEPALMLKYYTDVNISDVNALSKEVDDIWQFFKNDVERAGLKSAIISANELPMGIITKTKGRNYVFTKQADGSWKMEK